MDSAKEQAWVRERMEVLSVREKMIYSALAKRSPPQCDADVVNLLLSLDSCDVCVGAGDHAALGKYYLDYEVFPQLDKFALHFIDLEKLGKKYEAQHPGVFQDGSYVILAESGEPLYDGEHLPGSDWSWSLRLKLASPWGTGGSLAETAGLWRLCRHYTRRNSHGAG